MTPTRHPATSPRGRYAGKPASGGLRGYTGAKLFEKPYGTKDFSLFERQARQGAALSQTNQPGVNPQAPQTVDHKNYITIETPNGKIQIAGGEDKQRKKLAEGVNKLLTAKSGQELIATALRKQNGKLLIYAINDKTNAYWNDTFHAVQIDPRYTPKQKTTAGSTVTPNFIVLAHEIGHGAGAEDRDYQGKRNMENVILWENRIRRDFGIPERTEY